MLAFVVLCVVALAVSSASSQSLKDAESYYMVLDKKNDGYELSIASKLSENAHTKWTDASLLASIPVNDTLRKFNVDVTGSDFTLYWSLYSIVENKYIDYTCVVETNGFCKPEQSNKKVPLQYFVDISRDQNMTQELCADYQNIVMHHKPQQQIIWKSELGIVLIHDANVMRSCNAL